MLSRIIAFFVLASIAATSAAYWTAQDMTENEWAAWPPHCQAAFLSSEWSMNSPFRGRLSPERMKAALLTNSIDGSHHFCIALIAMNRSITKPPTIANQLMKTAVAEINYSRSRMDPASPQFSYVSAYFAKALHGSGERNKAFEVWNQCIERTPAAHECYLLKAKALVSEKRLDEALEVLQAFDAKKEQPRADAEYFLGYVYFQLRKYPEARRHLDNAKQLGYPSDSLRNQLTKMGH